MAEALVREKERILLANAEDLANARVSGMRESLMDRLTLTDARIEAIAEGIKAVVALDDPTSRILGGWQRPNGLWIEKRCVPLGVIGIIYEARTQCYGGCRQPVHQERKCPAFCVAARKLLLRTRQS